MDVNGYKISNYGVIIGRNGKKIAPVGKNGYCPCHIDLGDPYGKVNGAHRVIATLFIPNPDSKPEVNHIDGNPSNNRVDNLEWVTAKENQQHEARTFGKRNGENCKKCKLTEKDVLEIYEKCKNGAVYKDVAIEYGVHPHHLGLILTGLQWKYLYLKPLARKKKSVRGTNLQTGEIKEYSSIKDATATGVQASSICACCKGKQKSAGGWKWEYIQNGDEDE